MQRLIKDKAPEFRGLYLLCACLSEFSKGLIKGAEIYQFHIAITFGTDIVIQDSNTQKDKSYEDAILLHYCSVNNLYCPYVRIPIKYCLKNHQPHKPGTKKSAVEERSFLKNLQTLNPIKFCSDHKPYQL